MTAMEFENHTECLALTSSVRATASIETGHRRILRRHEQLWLSEGQLDRVYMLEAGRLGVYSADAQGGELPLRTVVAGEWFGEYCFCPARDQPHRGVVARAEEDCRVVEVSSAAWIRYVSRSESAVRELVATMCRREAQSERRILMLARRSAEERVALLLLELATEDRDADRDRPNPVTWTHADIASATALSRAHVSVTLGQLRRRGLVRYGRRVPFTINVPKLRGFVDRLERRVRQNGEAHVFHR